VNSEPVTISDRHSSSVFDCVTVCHICCLSVCRSQLVASEGLKISNVQSSDDGIYVCHAENAAGSHEAHAKLSVLSTITTPYSLVTLSALSF